MTEAEWLECENPCTMLSWLGARASPRKLRLVVAAAARADWVEGKVPSADYSIWNDTLERAADSGNVEDWVEETPFAARWDSPLNMVALWLNNEPRPDRIGQTRDIFGNPFRPVAIDPAWLAWNSGIVSRIAQAVYDNRALPAGHLDPARLAILADALEEAGCADEALLSHLRSAGPHVRGCWALDLVLGKG